MSFYFFFFFSSRRRHTRSLRDWSSDVCSSDLALQAAPDHPWVKEHPEWFTTKPDGTIAYAENPPKKYQDIYPINFDNDRSEERRVGKECRSRWWPEQ